MVLSGNESKKIIGGSRVAGAIAVFVGTALSFVLGVIDGLSNPKGCNR